MSASPRPAAQPPKALDRHVLPAAVLASLDVDEEVYFYTQPARHALGRGVWMVMCLGIVFSVASFGAITDTWLGVQDAHAQETWQHMGFGLTLGLSALFLMFSLLLLAWPLLSYRAQRATHIVVTAARILQVRQRRRGRHHVRTWQISACPDAYVTRKRGATATLVLTERVRERGTDGQTIYEWEAIHGIPRASEALATLQALRP